MNSEDVRKLIELNEKVLAELDRQKEENEQTLREVKPQLERARAELRRAGYLR